MDDLERTLDELARGLDDLDLNTEGSIAPPEHTWPEGAFPQLAAGLPPLVAAGGIEVGEAIGEGAFGVVSSAIQVPLDREVAVKQVREELGDTAACRSLLREGRVLGRLEHPNIVPVYMLGADANDRPLIVMKRVEGVSWHVYIGEQGLTAPDGVLDRIDWHLRVLMQVANAAHFAHQRGVVHRDIKTSNVMVGAFGEVYLLDWGLALTIDTRAGLTVQRTKGAKRYIAGTLGFMPPEMATGFVELVDARTDVYMLGASLHHVVTGHARHLGDVRERIRSATLSEPCDYGHGVPSELAAICNRSMHREQAERYQTARAFHDALSEYLTHRSSLRLTRESATQLAHLRKRLDDPDAGDDHRIHRLAGECRFGFRAALREWPENPAAKRGHADVLEAMADHALAQGDANAVERLLQDHPDPPPLLKVRLEALKEQQSRTAEAVEARLRAVDPRLGRPLRAKMMLVLGAIWGANWLLYGVLARADVFAFGHLACGLTMLGHAVLMAATQRALAHALTVTEVSRSFVRGTRLSGLGALLVWPYAASTGVTVPAALGLMLLVFATGSATVASFIDKRMLAAPAVFVSGFFGCLVAPGLAFEITGVAIFGGMALGAQAWKWTDAAEARAR